MSRPAVPLVERLEAAGRDERLSTGALYLEAAMALAVTEAELAQSTTALSLAQTEIKGHMRVEDELQAEVARLRVMVDECHGWLEDARRKAQARIAELEKVLIQVREEWYGYTPYSKLKQDIDAALQDKIDK